MTKPHDDRPLAYVFWHWPRAGIPAPSYEAKLAAFLGALSEAGVPGLIEACSFRVGPLPWGPRRGQFYEDRYVVEDYASLEVLNEAAVTGSLRDPHNSIAADCMTGTAGLLRLVEGNLRSQESRAVAWLDKPAGKSYVSYHKELRALMTGKKASLWQRQMALGPSREFCILSDGAMSIPASLRPTDSRMKAILPQ